MSVSNLLKNDLEISGVEGHTMYNKIVVQNLEDYLLEVYPTKESDTVIRFKTPGRTFTINCNEENSATHDLFNCLLGFPEKESERKLGSIYMMGDRTDELRPDFTFLLQDQTMVHLEVTLSIDHDEFDRKRLKYMQTLKDRSQITGQKMEIAVIQVDGNHIISNFSLSAETRFRILEAYFSARECIKTLRSMSWLEKGSDLSSFTHIKTAFAGINLNPMRFPMTKDLIIKRKRNEDGTEYIPEDDKSYEKKRIAKKIVVDCWREAATEVSGVGSDPSFTYKETSVGVEFTGKGLLEVQKAQEKEIDDYYATHASDESAVVSGKSVFHIPFIVPKGIHEVTTDLSSFPFVPYSSGSDEMACYQRLFCSISQKIREGQVERANDEQEAVLDESGRPDKRAYHRAWVGIEERDRATFAQTGPFGKSYLKSDLVTQYRNKAKAPLKITSETLDIDGFLSDETMFEKIDKKEDNWEYDRPEMNLILESMMCHDGNPSTFGLEHVERVLSSKIGRYCTLVSDISQELCSSLQQHCNSLNGVDELVIKKLRNFNLWIVIKPTSSLKHIFFTMMWRKTDFYHPEHTGVFKSPFHDGTLYYSPWRSFNKSKLSTSLLTESDLICYHATWLDIFQESPFLGLSGEGYTRLAEKYTLLSLLVHMNDKSRVEEIMTMVRYTCMEAFVQLPVIPKVTKMISKFPKFFRSRLEIWVVKKQLSLMRRYVSGYLPQVHQGYWTNLVDPYFQEQLPSPYPLVNTFYVGYAKNKNELAQSNQEAQLVEKIIEYEKDMDMNFPYGVEEPPGDETLHDYSPSLLQSMLEFTETMLQSKNPRWRDDLEHTILKRISELDLVSLATSKASTGFTSSAAEMKEKVFKKGKFKLKHKFNRPRVMEAMQYYMNKYVDAWQSIAELCEKMLSPQQLDIFRKMQRGGLREIYVLEAHIRIAHAIIEIIARCICDLFESEMMSHPSKKMPTIDNHANKTRELLKETEKKEEDVSYITIGTSDDASKWSQGHLVTKFVTALTFMVPTCFHNFIANFFNTWMKRKILMPRGLFENILNNAETDFHPESFMSTLVSAFRGEVNPCWWEGAPGDKEAYITISSGMMQGIPHFTSSFFHSMIQEYWKSVATSLSPKAVISVMQSSDDSGALISLPYKKKTGPGGAIMHAQSLFRFKHKVAQKLGVKNSIKSTTGSVNMIEFNSEFVFLNNQFRPLFRWSAVANVMSDEETIVGWQNEMANSLTAVVEGGATMSCAHIIQISQALTFYRILGSRTMKAFETFQALAGTVRDPGKGFFLMDNLKICGMMGTKFNIYVVARESRFMRMTMKKLLEDPDILENNPGVPSFATSTATIRFGNRKKAERLIDKLNLPPNLDEVINNNCKAIFLKAMSVETSKVKFYAKASSASMYRSFSQSNNLARLATISPYALTSKCFFSRGRKWSLLELLHQDLHEGAEFDGDLTGEQLSLIFPYMKDYERVLLKLPRLDVYRGAKLDPKEVHTKHKKMSVNIMLTQKRLDDIAPPIDLARFKWFKVGSFVYTSNALDSAWEALKERLVWLKDSIEETLEVSGIRNAAQVKDVLAKMNEGHRKISLSGFVAAKRDYSENVEMVISRNFAPLYQVLTKRMISSQVVEDRERNLRNSIVRVLQSPCLDRYKAVLLHNVFSHDDTDISDLLTPKAGGSIKPLAVLQEIVQKSEIQRGRLICTLDDDINKHLGLARGVLMGKWEIIQEKVAGVWKGEGRWTGKILDTVVSAWVYDDKCLGVTCNRWENVTEVVRTLLLSLELKPIRNRVYLENDNMVFSGNPWNGMVINEGIGIPVSYDNITIPFGDYQDVEVSFSDDSITVRVMDEIVVERWGIDVRRKLSNCTWIKMKFNFWDFQPNRAAKINYDPLKEDGVLPYPLALEKKRRGYLRVWLDSKIMTLEELDVVYQLWKSEKIKTLERSKGVDRYVFYTWSTRDKVQKFMRTLAAGKFNYLASRTKHKAEMVVEAPVEVLADLIDEFGTLKHFELLNKAGPIDIFSIQADMFMDVLTAEDEMGKSTISGASTMTNVGILMQEISHLIDAGELPKEFETYHGALEWLYGFHANISQQSEMDEILRREGLLMPDDAESSIHYPELPTRERFPKESDDPQLESAIKDMLGKDFGIEVSVESALSAKVIPAALGPNDLFPKRSVIQCAAIILKMSADELRDLAIQDIRSNMDTYRGLYSKMDDFQFGEFNEFWNNFQRGDDLSGEIVIRAISRAVPAMISVIFTDGSVTIYKEKDNTVENQVELTMIKKGNAYLPVIEDSANE